MRTRYAISYVARALKYKGLPARKSWQCRAM